MSEKNTLTINWTELSMDDKWYDLFTGDVVPEPVVDAEGAFILISPYPSELASVVVKDGGILITGSQQKEIYDHCFKEFRGKSIIDADGKQLKFSKEVKEKIFEFKLGDIPNFVITKSWQYSDKKGASEGNS